MFFIINLYIVTAKFPHNSSKYIIIRGKFIKRNNNLILQDRIIIQKEYYKGTSFCKIRKILGYSHTTIKK